MTNPAPARSRAERLRAQRDYARHRRQAKLDERRSRAERCPRRFGKHGICGELLETGVLRDGTTEIRCSACERMRAGICKDCPRPVAGTVRKARRCESCKRSALRGYHRRYAKLNRKLVNRRARRSYNDDPERRAARNEYKRLWRQANPEKVREQKRRYELRRNERYREYHAAYRAKRRAETAELQRGRRRGDLPARNCLTCPTPVGGRRKKCDPCRARARSMAEKVLASHHSGRGRRTDLQ